MLLRAYKNKKVKDDCSLYMGVLNVTDSRKCISKLKIMRKEGGEATGEGYVKFSRQDEATAALEKHMQKIGYRYSGNFSSCDLATSR